jgi:hypothetical protein
MLTQKSIFVHKKDIIDREIRPKLYIVTGI